MNLDDIRGIIDNNADYAFDGDVERSLIERGYGAKLVWENDWGEGASESVKYVIKVVKGDEEVFVQLTGWYNSWDGTEYGSCKEVKPFQFSETRYK